MSHLSDADLEATLAQHPGVLRLLMRVDPLVLARAAIALQHAQVPSIMPARPQ